MNDADTLVRVSRASALRSSQSPSRSLSPTARALPFAFEYEYVAPAPVSLPAAAEDAQESDDDDMMAFSLFSSRPALKISLRSPTPEADPYELMAKSQKRPESYYFSKGLGEKGKEVAVAGQELKAWAESSVWMGDRRPWRVIEGCFGEVLAKEMKEQLKGVKVVKIQEEAGKRKKPGKKRRLQVRLKERKAKEEEEAKLKAEEHKKEKAKRKNQQRKGKRREKAKLARQAAKAGGSEIGEGDAMEVDHSEGGEKEDDAMEE